MLQLIHNRLNGECARVQRMIKEYIISVPLGNSCNCSSKRSMAFNVSFTQNSHSFQINSRQLHKLSLCTYYVLGINHNNPFLQFDHFLKGETDLCTYKYDRQHCIMKNKCNTSSKCYEITRVRDFYWGH